LSIPAVRDRIVQAAVKIVLEPVFEAGFLPCSFGFRPRRSAHDGLLTGRRWLPLRPETIAEEMNRFLRGWAGYFRYGHSAQRLSKIRQYARMRLALFISKKHRRSRGFGCWPPCHRMSAA
jgi:hypothetical protein